MTTYYCTQCAGKYQPGTRIFEMRVQDIVRSLFVGTAAIAMTAVVTSIDSTSGAGFAFVSQAKAQGSGQGQGKMMQGESGQDRQGGQGGQGDGKGGDGKGGTGGVPRGVGSAEDGPDTSDRPPWAGSDPTEPKPSGRGGGRPDTAGTMKGDIFGDLIDVEWTAAGSPELDDDGNLKVVAYVDTDADGDGDVLLTEYLGLVGDPTLLIQWATDAEGDPVLTNVAYDEANPDATYSGAYTIVPGNVEFGRTSAARSPDGVLQQQIDEFESLLSSAVPGTVALTPEGRITMDVMEGDTQVAVTVDSPLVNLALYTVLMGTTRDLELDPTALATLNDIGVVPQALLAAAADKTATITVDYVAYLDTALGINVVERDTATKPPSTTITYEDLSSYTYTRSDTWSADVIAAVFGGEDLVATQGIDAFAQAADDYLQVIEYVHDNPGVLF